MDPYVVWMVFIFFVGVCLFFGAVSFLIHRAGGRWLSGRQLATVAFGINVVIAFVAFARSHIYRLPTLGMFLSAAAVVLLLHLLWIGLTDV